MVSQVYRKVGGGKHMVSQVHRKVGGGKHMVSQVHQVKPSQAKSSDLRPSPNLKLAIVKSSQAKPSQAK